MLATRRVGAVSVVGSEIDQRWTVQVYVPKAFQPPAAVSRTFCGSRVEALEFEAELRTALRRGALPPQRRWYPFAFLERALGTSDTGELARRLGVPTEWVFKYRCRPRGLTERVADRLATAAGLHPAEVWAHWFD